MREEIIPQFIVSAIVTVGFISILTLLLYSDLPTSVEKPFMILVGVLASAFGAVINYWLGSSSSSAAKSAVIEEIARS